MAESGTRTQLINLEGLNTFLNESKKIFEPTLPAGTDGQVLKLSGGKPKWGTDNTPTTFSWTGGTTDGPTGSLSGNGMSAVAFPAVPSASESASGVVTTGNQTFEGTKTFNKTIAGSITGNAVTLSLLQGPSDASRFIIFQDSKNSTSKLEACYDADFKYNPISNLMNVGSVQLNSKVTLQYNSSTESLDFVFA